MTLIEEKRRLRGVMVARRAELSEERRRAAADRLCAAFFDEKPFALPAVVTAFWSINEEIDVRPLMHALVEAGCRLALPVVQGKRQPLVFRAWSPGDELEAGVFGTFHPFGHREVLEPDALLVPLLACDGEGWRLGYGGGFYDRTLTGLRARRRVTAVGVGYDEQVIEAVPHGPDDERLDWLLTDRRACAFV
ncbi:5-formyltetrahydrofolate cyclo-ligase [Reyranella sp.]|uniref:5-formyltetrahydrofolate cyclo-ligase n=1 Tax=Reyranella sp. TaxID=1929291 RepID=UPI003784F96F